MTTSTATLPQRYNAADRGLCITSHQSVEAVHKHESFFLSHRMSPYMTYTTCQTMNMCKQKMRETDYTCTHLLEMCSSVTPMVYAGVQNAHVCSSSQYVSYSTQENTTPYIRFRRYLTIRHGPTAKHSLQTDTHAADHRLTNCRPLLTDQCTHLLSTSYSP